MLNLRTIEGLDIAFVKDKAKEIDAFIKDGLLKKEGNRLIATYLGMMVLDQIILKLM